MIDLQTDKYNKICVVAPMSSGKSTLINALLGSQLLPASNYACTATKQEIVINKRLKNPKIHYNDDNGKKMCIRNAGLQDVEQLNGTSSGFYIESNLAGNIYTKKQLLIIDTPGTNYFDDKKHFKATHEVLGKIEDSIILYVMNVSHVGTEDEVRLLNTIADNLRKKNQLIIVLNKVDSLDRSKESIEDFMFSTIPKQMTSLGIDQYHLIACSGEAALLFRRALKYEDMSASDSDKLYRYYKYFARGDSNSLERYSFSSDLISEEETIKIDEELYSIRKLKMALKSTGICELENCISQACFSKR